MNMGETLTKGDIKFLRAALDARVDLHINDCTEYIRKALNSLNLETERCAEIAEEEDNGDLGGRIAERIAAKIRESSVQSLEDRKWMSRVVRLSSRRTRRK